MPRDQRIVENEVLRARSHIVSAWVRELFDAYNDARKPAQRMSQRELAQRLGMARPTLSAKMRAGSQGDDKTSPESFFTDEELIRLMPILEAQDWQRHALHERLEQHFSIHNARARHAQTPGAFLRAKADALGLTPVMVAQAAQLDRDVVTDAFTDHESIAVESLRRMADALQLSLAECTMLRALYVKQFARDALVKQGEMQRKLPESACESLLETLAQEAQLHADEPPVRPCFRYEILHNPEVRPKGVSAYYARQDAVKSARREPRYQRGIIIAEWVRDVMAAHNPPLTQGDLARMLGRSESAITNKMQASDSLFGDDDVATLIDRLALDEPVVAGLKERLLAWHRQQSDRAKQATTLGQFLQHKLDAFGYTQADAVRASDGVIDSSILAKSLQDRQALPVVQMRRLADVLQLSPLEREMVTALGYTAYQKDVLSGSQAMNMPQPREWVQQLRAHSQARIEALRQHDEPLPTFDFERLSAMLKESLHDNQTPQMQVSAADAQHTPSARAQQTNAHAATLRDTLLDALMEYSHREKLDFTRDLNSLAVVCLNMPSLQRGLKTGFEPMALHAICQQLEADAPMRARLEAANQALRNQALGRG